MEINIDSWLYNLWYYTFAFSNSIPGQTTRWRFWLRVIFLPIPVCISIIGLAIFWVVATIILNLFSILSGRGVCVTWTDNTYIREFGGITIGNTLVSGQNIACLLWTCLVIACLAYVYPDVFSAHWWFVVKIVSCIAFVVAFSHWIVTFADGREIKDEGRLMRQISEAYIYKRPIPAEIVVFVEPNIDSKESVE